jgi:hypothetical protein
MKVMSTTPEIPVKMEKNTMNTVECLLSLT